MLALTIIVWGADSAMLRPRAGTAETDQVSAFRPSNTGGLKTIIARPAMAPKSRKDKCEKDAEITTSQGDTPETLTTGEPQKLSNKELERLQGKLIKLQYRMSECHDTARS
jgi:hypothetical protein